MKRIWTALLAAILLIPMTFQSQAQAAVNISVLIDGVKLYTPQAPVMIQGRVMLPMRSIFEALDASVKWNQKTKTVTAVKDGTTVILKINSKTATINNKTVALDVPAKNLKGNTMVPVRFVSEALGQKIGWNSKTKTVTVTTTNNSGGNNTGIAPVNYVTLRDIGNAGDGRDLQVSFSKSSTEPLISHYRVMIVKQSKTLNQTEAQRVSSAAYATVYPSGSDPTLTLTSGSKDVDGDLIRDNQAYKAYVLAVSKTGGAYALSSASPSLTLTNTNSVNGATNVKASDVSDYGDGRDLQVSFTRAQNESNVSNYRVFVVKTKDAANFNLAAAKSVASQNYTTVSKSSTTNTTLSTTLSSSARDTSGELIRSGVAYTVFVQSVSSNESVLASNLSSGSASITLSTGNTTVPFITQVTDIGDAGDGRDLRVSFNKVSNESSIHSYRVFVVKDSNYSSFNLSRANTASSYNYYTHVNKTGNNITNLTLSSGARDVDGATIRNGVYYRVFVMAVDNNNANNNVLSAPSSSIILSSSYNVGAVTSLSVTDVNNYNDGRDLQVSFYRPSDQSNISHYQVFVVKSSNSYFDLYRANNLSSYYYTQISKNNSSSNYMSQVLNSGSRDIDGELIRNGVSYRVYVLSVGYSTSNNALSDYASITLGNANQNVNPVSTPSLTLNGNNGNGSDLRVTFSPAYGESYIDHYRVIVVKSNQSLNVSQAYSNGYYTLVNKTGGTITRDLVNTTKDSDGALIQRGSSYRVYVLSVGNSYSNYSNALSAVSNAVTIQGVTQVAAVTNVTAADVGDNNNASDLKVSFTKAAHEANIKEYRIMVVKQTNAGSFTVAQANNVGNDNYDSVPVGFDFSKALRAETRDVEGQPIRNSVDYQVFVLSVSNNGSIGNALSAPSAPIKLSGTAVTVPSDVYAGIESTNGNSSDIMVKFNPSSGTVGEYRILIVPSSRSFGLDDANKITNGQLYTTVAPSTVRIEQKLSAGLSDVTGAAVVAGVKYRVYILAVADGTVSTKNSISDMSEEFEIPNLTQTTGVTAKLDASGKKLQVDFKRAIDERGITAYRLLFVEKNNMKTFNLKAATDAAAKEDKNATIKPDGKDVSTLIDIPAEDALGQNIKDNAEYAVYVLSVLAKDKKSVSSTQSATPLSEASKTLVVLKKTP
ncbi:hypothetical protein J28TS4_50430 [Paenibacillus lautus]|uniref:copper amine oxidase N-terminal domain-containing protein n=1 Tax=Paenibacillus lautus TaxID=1401 RepID=UPI001B1C4074|nr:copper amine oxidase N-terminal domain-containing protein [Paenibacillus lautus]GIP06636.1 hypothetical protein J28TS4_50430 [Paenibacillus lautus]